MNEKKLILSVVIIVGCAALVITSFFLDPDYQVYLALGVGVVVGLNMSLLQSRDSREGVVPLPSPAVSPQPVVAPVRPTAPSKPAPEINVPQFEEEVEEEPEEEDVTDSELEELRQKLALLQKERAEMEKKSKKPVVKKPKVILKPKRKRRVSSPDMMDFPEDLR